MTADCFISDEQERAIRAVPHFAHGVYRDMDINGALDFYLRRYVGPLGAFTDLGPQDVVADIGTGYGWLAIAFALHTPARVVAVDMDEARLDAAKRIAGIIGVAHRIDWRAGRLGELPLADGEARITYCIEVIEHIGRSRQAVRDLGRVSAEMIVITTPNLYFPVIAHDTGLPFCHWLPLPLRARYAELCGRRERENDNLLLVTAQPPGRAPRVPRRLALPPLRLTPPLPRHLPLLRALCGRRRAPTRRTPQVALLCGGLLTRAPFALCHALPGLHAPPRK